MTPRAQISPSFDARRQVLGEILPLDTPFTVIIDTGDVCNFRCSYCFRGKAASFDCGYYRRNILISWEAFQRAADHLCGFPQAPKAISLSNHGEPLCNPALPRMATYIKKDLGVPSRISIHTNASLLDKRMADGLAAAGLDRMVVSVQGLSAEDYRAVCGAGIDFERFLRQLEYFYSIKTTTEVCVKIVDDALHGPEQAFYELFAPMADRVFVEKVVPIWGAAEGRIRANKFGDTFPRVDCCILLFHTLVVTADGTILPCTHLRPSCDLGTIFDTTLAEAWRSEARTTLLRAMLQKGLNRNGVCHLCQLAQNSVYAECDIIDRYRLEILRRMDTANGNHH